jgi:hypothetical protein
VRRIGTCKLPVIYLIAEAESGIDWPRSNPVS